MSALLMGVYFNLHSNSKEETLTKALVTVGSKHSPGLQTGSS